MRVDVDWDALELVFLLPMPPSWGKAKRARMRHTPHKQRPDVDNLCKSVLDALLSEDSHVWNIKAKKLWSITGAIIVKTV